METLSKKDFNQEVFDHLKTNPVCDGFHFKYDIELDFSKEEWVHGLSFTNAVFHSDFSLRKLRLMGALIFQKSIFKGSCQLSEIELYPHLRDGEFRPVSLNVHGAEFYGRAYFQSLKFIDGGLYCGEAIFHDDLIASFDMQNSSIAAFSNCSFNGLKIHASNVRDLHLEHNTVHSQLEISDVRLLDGGIQLKNNYFTQTSSVVFAGVRLEDAQEANGKNAIQCEGNVFPQFKTSFIGFDFGGPAFASLSFKYCDLTNCYFQDCNFSGISLYTSLFSNTHFLNCIWLAENENWFRGRREYVLFEDYNREKLSVALPEVINMYSQLKTAFDSNKRYIEAGQFYYNECELRGRLYRERNEWHHFIYFRIVGFLTGYSQRPWRSILAALMSIGIFAAANLLFGLETRLGNEVVRHIDYELSPTLWFLFEGQFWSDYLDALTFAFVRIIPLNYYGVTDVIIVSQTQSVAFLLLNVFYSVFLFGLISSSVIGFRRLIKRF